MGPEVKNDLGKGGAKERENPRLWLKTNKEKGTPDAKSVVSSGISPFGWRTIRFPPVNERTSGGRLTKELNRRGISLEI
jgi:hypothetical protein